MSRRGVTLIEMIIVVAIIGLIASISFPSVAAGLDGVRLRSGSESIAGFLTGAVNRSERRQEVVEIAVLMKQNALAMRSSEPGFERRLDLPDGVLIDSVVPPPPEPDAPRVFLLLPGAAPPNLTIVLKNRRGGIRRIVLDPATGVPRVEIPGGNT